MIDALTPLILSTTAAAGGPLSLSGLMQRLRDTLSDARLRQHVRDLVSSGQLTLSTDADGQQATVSITPGTEASCLSPTFFGAGEARLREPRRLSISQKTDLVSKRMVAAATRDGKRPRSAPGRARMLTLLDEQPMTTEDLTHAMGITHNQARDHLNILQRGGLVVRYATTRNANGNPLPIWVSTRLRSTLPGPPPTPPRIALIRRKAEREARLQHHH